MNDLAAFVAAALARELPTPVRVAAERLAAERGGVAVLFYGSVLRTGALGDILDFYVLTDRPPSGRARLWPDVSYHELPVDGQTMRAKVATMPLGAFAQMARGERRDTTIWTRFCQPAALAWAARPTAEANTVAAVTEAAITAARVAALHGPAEGTAGAYWSALFRATYATELRVEAPGREAEIVARSPDYFAALLPLAWQAGAVTFTADAERLSPFLTPAQQRALTRAWQRARRAGKALNVARLVKAAFTFEGAGAYGLYKVARHTGVDLPLTPWRARHPILAAPAVLWRVWRAR